MTSLHAQIPWERKPITVRAPLNCENSAAPPTLERPEGIFAQHLHHLLLGDTTRTIGGTRRATLEALTPPETASERLGILARSLWASSTLSQRRHLFIRWHEWCQRYKMRMDDSSAALFVAATGVSPQAQLCYAKQLSAGLGHLGLPAKTLQSMAAALRATGAAIPIHQAAPLSRNQLRFWASCQPLHLRLALLLAWKTASRWADVQTLRRSQFLVVSPNEIVVDWGTTPKGRRGRPFHPSKLVVVQGPWTDEIAQAVEHLGNFAQLTTVTTATLDALWKMDPVMHAYSAHSIKRGALSHLFELAATGVDVPQVPLALLAKHATTAALSATTIRYGANPVAMARMLGTQQVTRLL